MTHSCGIFTTGQQKDEYDLAKQKHAVSKCKKRDKRFGTLKMWRILTHRPEGGGYPGQFSKQSYHKQHRICFGSCW